MHREKRTGRPENRENRIKGFTLAELLITVAITLILAGIGFLAVSAYQRNLKLTEMDGTARQVFIAAQNHLTGASGSGDWETYVQNAKNGTSGYSLGTAMTTKPSDYTGDWDADQSSHAFYYIVYTPGNNSVLTDTALKILLPYGAIDETVRSDRSYVIEYDASTASVYAVFYTDSSQQVTASDVASLNSSNGRGDSSAARSVRKNYRKDGRQDIIGYYGGAEASSLQTVSLQNPQLTIDNGDRLNLTVTDPNYYQTADGTASGQRCNTRIVLTVTGEESGKSQVLALNLNNTTTTTAAAAKAASAAGENWWTAVPVQVTVNGTATTQMQYTVCLDDLSSVGGHFADLCPDLIPGENILIKAECTSNDVLCSTTRDTGYTNSLFESTTAVDASDQILTTADGAVYENAAVSCSRHLQNLNIQVSGVPYMVNGTNGNSRYVKFVSVTKDIDWKDWLTVNGRTVAGATQEASVYGIAKNGSARYGTEQFYAIKNYGITGFSGNGHLLYNLDICANADTGNAGLFAQSGERYHVTELNIQDVFLVDIKVTATGTGSAGALIGAAGQDTIRNCGVYASTAANYAAGAYSVTDSKLGSGNHIAADSGHAGGLIGCSLTDSYQLTVEDCFAAEPVSSVSGYAGGLIGWLDNSHAAEGAYQILNSYAGGYVETDGTYSNTTVNVSQTGMVNNDTADGGNNSNGGAGGLIGGLTGSGAVPVTVKNCYSTCSVYGMNAGGLVAKDRLTTDCTAYTGNYCTGLVLQNTATALGTTYAGELFGAIRWVGTNDSANYALKGVNSGLQTMGNIGLGYSSASGTYTAEEFATIASGDLITATSAGNNAAATVQTHAYNAAQAFDPAVYPYGTTNKAGFDATDANAATQTGVHYGDWPKVKLNAVGDVALLYYEIVDGVVYYDGYGADLSTTPEDAAHYHHICSSDKAGTDPDNGLLTGAASDGKIVTEDGYIMLVPDGTMDSLGFHLPNNNYAGSYGVMNTLQLLTPYTSLDVGIDGYSAYYFDMTAYSGCIWYYQTARSAITVTNGAGTTWTKSADFTHTPFFADTVKAGTDTTGTTYHIRSAHQLNTLASYTNAGTIGYVGAWYTAGTLCYQDMDISYDSNIAYTVKGTAVTYASPEFSGTNGQFCATYESVIHEDANGNQTPYKLYTLTSPLIDHLLEGKLINVYVDGINMDGSKSYGFIGTMEEDTLVQNLEIHNVSIANSSLTLNIRVGTATGAFGLIGYNNKGTVKGFKTDTVDMSRLAIYGSGSPVYLGIIGYNSGTVSDLDVQNTTMSQNSIVSGYFGIVGYNSGTITNMNVNQAKVHGEFVMGTTSCVGVVGSNSGSISDVTMDTIDIGADLQSVYYCNGKFGLIAQNEPGGSVTNCTANDVDMTGVGTENNFHAKYAAVTENAGSISNMTISNYKTMGSGFVYQNESTGTVDHCAIYKTSDSVIGTVRIGTSMDTYDRAGFVFNNYGSVKNSSVTGYVNGQNAAGFVDTNNNGTITDCYTDTLLYANNDAMGFVDTNTYGTITGCHSLGQMIGKGGHCDGFVEENIGTIQDSYSAVWNMQAKTNNFFMFEYANDTYNGHITNCYYLTDCTAYNLSTGKLMSGLTSARATGVSYQTLATGVLTDQVHVTAQTTHKYGLFNTDPLDVVYPFPVPSTDGTAVEHYGDWSGSPYTGLAYYEDYSNLSGVTGADGKSYGLYVEAVGTGSAGSTANTVSLNTLATSRNTAAIPDSNPKYGMVVSAGSSISSYSTYLDTTKKVTFQMGGRWYEFYPFTGSYQAGTNPIATYYKDSPLNASTKTFTYPNSAANMTIENYSLSKQYYNTDFAAAISADSAALGTVSAPYQIRTQKQFRNISASSYYYNGSRAVYLLQSYDVTLTSDAVTQVGTFGEIYDGDGQTDADGTNYTVNGFTQNGATVGFAGNMRGTIKNTTFNNASVTLTASNRDAGIFCCDNYGTISNCNLTNSTMQATATTMNSLIIGGITGGGSDGGVIQNTTVSGTTVKLTGGTLTNSGNIIVGGIIGHIWNNTTLTGDKVTDSNVTVTTASTDNENTYGVGGMIGLVTSNNSTTTVTGCEVDNTPVTVTGSGTNMGVGGFLGNDRAYASNFVCSDCTVKGTSTTPVAITTVNNGTKACNTGGFVGLSYIYQYAGYARTSTYSNCQVQFAAVTENNGTSTVATGVGGFAGQIDQRANSQKTVLNSCKVSSVDVSQTGNGGYTGGFLGYLYNTSGQVSATDCSAQGLETDYANVSLKNTGTLAGYVGGFLGYAGGQSALGNSFTNCTTRYLKVWQENSQTSGVADSSTGGFVGQTGTELTKTGFTNCTAADSLVKGGAFTCYLGGFVGRDPSATTTYTNCAVVNPVLDARNMQYTTAAAPCYVGGFAGYKTGTAGSIQIDGCTVYDGSADQLMQSTSKSKTTNDDNYGTILEELNGSSPQQYAQVGGFAGTLNAAGVRNCAAVTDITNESRSGTSDYNNIDTAGFAASILNNSTVTQSYAKTAFGTRMARNINGFAVNLNASRITESYVVADYTQAKGSRYKDRFVQHITNGVITDCHGEDVSRNITTGMSYSPFYGTTTSGDSYTLTNNYLDSTDDYVKKNGSITLLPSTAIKNTTAFSTQATFAGWNFSTIWQMTNNGSFGTYPTLQGTPETNLNTLAAQYPDTIAGSSQGALIAAALTSVQLGDSPAGGIYVALSDTVPTSFMATLTDGTSAPAQGTAYALAQSGDYTVSLQKTTLANSGLMSHM